MRKSHRRLAPGLYIYLIFFLSGCASLPAYRVGPPEFPNDQQVHFIQKAPPVGQRAYQCGPAALESVMRRWGYEVDAEEIGRDLGSQGARGVLNFTLAQVARDRGFWTEMHESNLEELKGWIRNDIPPLVALQVGPFWSFTYHFVVLTGFNDREGILYANIGYPETRAIRVPHFLKSWQRAGNWTLIVCPLERVDWQLSADQAGDLGFLLEKSAQLPLAEKWYRAALAKEPDNRPVRFNLANILFKTGQFQKAKLMYQQLIKENPAEIAPINNLASVFLEEGNPKEAVRLIETAFKNGVERRADILDTLGLAYCRRKQYPKARHCFREALDKTASDDFSAKTLIRAHLDQCFRGGVT